MPGGRHRSYLLLFASTLCLCPAPILNFPILLHVCNCCADPLLPVLGWICSALPLTHSFMKKKPLPGSWVRNIWPHLTASFCLTCLPQIARGLLSPLWHHTDSLLIFVSFVLPFWPGENLSQCRKYPRKGMQKDSSFERMLSSAFCCSLLSPYVPKWTTQNFNLSNSF